MRVTIDAIPLLSRSAGVKSYLYHWVLHLYREAHGIDIRLFPFLKPPSSLDHENSSTNPLGTFARLGLFHLLNRIPSGAAWGNRPVSLFHTCKFLNPPRGAKLTATVHDLTCWLLPETHRNANVAFEKHFAEKILKRADALIAVSESTRKDAVRILDLSSEKIHVIHHGVADVFFSARAANADEFCSYHGIKRPYLLFVGTIEPRKNVDLLISAYNGLPRSITSQFDLVVAGPAGWLCTNTMMRLRQRVAGVRYVGYVPQKNLPGLFAGASAFVYPSLYEGFGLPVAEAMATGVPVITSAVSSLPEITDGAALLVDPRSEAELRQAIETILTSPSVRTKLSERGRARARDLSWSECARKSLQLFQSMVC